MLRAILLMLALLLPTVSRAQSVEEIEVGGQTVRVEMPAGYVRVGQRSPMVLELLGRLIPPNNVLIEALTSEQDYARMLAGEPSVDTYYQIQTVRVLREAPISAAEWTQLRPTMVRDLGGLETERLMDYVSEHVTETVTSGVGEETRVRMGDADTKPRVYGDDPRSVRFSMVVPIETKIGGEVRRGRVVTVAATTVVSERLLFLYAFQVLAEDAPADTASTRAALDAFVERVYRLNPQEK